VSTFADAWVKRQPALDRVFAETIRLVPMLAGGYTAPLVDPDRAERLVPAIISETPERKHTVRNAVGRDFDPAIVLADTVASIDSARLGGDLPRPGDRVIAVDRPEAPAFEITVVESDGLARVLLSLVRIEP
jgi:hypothetical protein